LDGGCGANASAIDADIDNREAVMRNEMLYATMMIPVSVLLSTLTTVATDAERKGMVSLELVCLLYYQLFASALF
jgi:hypothetical protein